MGSELTEDDIDFSRGDKEIVFVKTESDTEEIAEEDDPRQAALNDLEEQGLEMENVQLLGIFKGEYGLVLKEDAELVLNDEQIYPK